MNRVHVNNIETGLEEGEALFAEGRIDTVAPKKLGLAMALPWPEPWPQAFGTHLGP